MPQLNHLGDPVALTVELVNIYSESWQEADIATAVEASLTAIAQQTGLLEVVRVSNTVAARTQLGRDQRVILAGHLDTVPAANNLPARLDGGTIHGLGSVDMKSGDAVFLHLIDELVGRDELTYDITAIFYEREEIAAEHSGILQLQAAYPEWFTGDLAILGEPTGGRIEAGCQGSIRIKVTAHGTRAHSARAWLGENALHKLGPILTRIAGDGAREVSLDGCTYREGLNAVTAQAGVATNTIPDEASMFVNFRYAPDRSTEAAVAHICAVIAGLNEDELLSAGSGEAIVATANQSLADNGEWIDLALDDVAPAAPPRLSTPLAQRLIQTVSAGVPADQRSEWVRAKFGWTDVARFAQMGIPALNFGPGDPAYAHKPDEQCPVDQITTVATALRTFLMAVPPQS